MDFCLYTLLYMSTSTIKFPAPKKGEKWQYINCKDLQPLRYLISNFGRIWDSKRCRFKKTHYNNCNGYVAKRIPQEEVSKNRYMVVNLITILKNENKNRPDLKCKSKLYTLHRLMLSTFKPVEGMENLQTDHIDGNPRNNDLSNLRWLTKRDNTRVLDESEVRHILKELMSGKRPCDIARKMGREQHHVMNMYKPGVWVDIKRQVGWKLDRPNA